MSEIADSLNSHFTSVFQREDSSLSLSDLPEIHPCLELENVLFSEIFEASLKSATLPLIWKKANVTPIFKKGCIKLNKKELKFISMDYYK